MGTDERTQKLLFELSNKDRMDLLHDLKEKSMMLSQLAGFRDIRVSTENGPITRGTFSTKVKIGKLVLKER